jgi:hypothetical protein
MERDPRQAPKANAPDAPESDQGEDDASDPGRVALASRLVRLREAPPPAPPPSIELRLRASLATRRARRNRTAALGIGSALAAAAALLLWLRPASDTGEPAPADRPAVPQPGETIRGTGTGGARQAPTAPGRGQFWALGFAPETETVFTHSARVELGAETAAYFGWPVAADLPRARIQADVLYGEDGVARGLRFLPASFRTPPLPGEREE